jgi:hypothetical protein
LRYRSLIVLSLAVSLGACSATQVYSRAKPGRLVGDLSVSWVANDCFVYSPNPSNPFRFERSGNKPVTPQRIYTDGGSIPRVLWAFPQFSPWGYAPAYVVHDWLFEAHHCHVPDSDVPFEESATILLEAIKTQMEDNPDVKDVTAAFLIYEAVRTPIARRVWDQPGCTRPPPERTEGTTPPDSAMRALQQFPVVLKIQAGHVARLDTPAIQPHMPTAAEAEGAAFWRSQCPVSRSGGP